MKVNFNQSFKDYKGESLGVNISDEVGKILFNLSTSGQIPLSADEKYMAYKLCNRITSLEEVELTNEEAAFIVKVCGENFKAGAYGQIVDIMEGRI